MKGALWDYCLFRNWQLFCSLLLFRGDGSEISCKTLALCDAVDIVVPLRPIVSQPVISSFAKLKALCVASSCNLGCEI